MNRMWVVALAACALAPGAGAQTDPRGRIFVARGCSECHAVSALGVPASSDVGPDLTYAYGDVRRRHGLSLESFLTDPTGVMRMMLASHLRLTVADRDSIVHVLRQVFEARCADAEAGVPTLPRTGPCPP